MPPDVKAIAALTDIVAKALSEASHRQTLQTLGDRSTYVGMSDIARASDCLRAAVANKVGAVSASSLEKTLRLHRGHWFEHGIVSALVASKLPLLHQLTIQTREDGVPISAHLDLVLFEQGNNGSITVKIVEIKSCETIPKTAYSSYEMQLYGQLGLLQSCWGKPCFSLNNGKPQTFLELVKSTLGISLPARAEQVHLEGSILAVSMNTAVEFGPYEPNAIMLDSCLSLGKQIWSYKAQIESGQATLDDVPTAKGHHPLCDYCDVNAACPRFEGTSVAEIEDDLAFLQSLKEEKDRICKTIQQEEEKLKHLCKASLPGGGWLSALSLRMRLSACEGKRTLDKELLLSELEKHLDADIALEVLEASYKISAGYDRLSVSPIN